MTTEFVLKTRQLFVGSTVVFALLYLFGCGVTAFFVVALFALILLGFYSIAKVGKMACQFDSCEEAKVELEGEIVEAKRWYTDNGYAHLVKPEQDKTKDT